MGCQQSVGWVPGAFLLEAEDAHAGKLLRELPFSSRRAHLFSPSGKGRRSVGRKGCCTVGKAANVFITVRGLRKAGSPAASLVVAYVGAARPTNSKQIQREHLPCRGLGQHSGIECQMLTQDAVRLGDRKVRKNNGKGR